MASDVIRTVALVNSLTATTISIVANISVIAFIATQRRSSFKGHNYIYTILYIAFVHIIYSINQVLAAPMIHIHTDELIFVNNGVLQHETAGQVSLCIFSFFVIYSVLFCSTQFIIKYFIICRFNNRNRSDKIYSLHIVTFLIAFSWSFLLGWALWDSREHNVKEGHGLDAEFAGKPSLDSSIRENPALVVAIFLLFFLVLVSLLVMIFCSRRITLTLKNLRSDKSKNIQIRMYKILLAETVLPLMLIHLPLLASCFLPLINLHVDIILDSLPLLYAWYPALDPLVVLWNLKMKDIKMKKFYKRSTTVLAVAVVTSA
ncbi:hypothetical protein Y032_0058g2926 [Ancylostoma ceylanicum]|uniref:G-protein coupled receptors family 1 profile domain-containing protein n=1 Tax=Ancylostoma ceylanicum TaxID=53326 RepID=A0A016U5X6_9BILA|nr:hypothetical protein Y032_0058g2926 [Ancylostoma ceylanicum]